MIIETESVTCDLCGSNKSVLKYRLPDRRMKRFNQEYSVVACSDCDHNFLNPRPLVSEFNKIYPASYYHQRGVALPNQRRRYEKQADYFANVPIGNVLDIGCARGDFLKIMKERGWKCFGTDFVDRREMEQEMEIDFRFGQLYDLDYESEMFDAVSAWGVFEHLTEPRRYFQEVRRVLKPTGKFVMLVPNGDSLWTKFAFKEDIPRHLQFFNSRSLTMYGSKTGLIAKKFEFTNILYSKPASGRDGFRVNFLRWLGVPWSKIDQPLGQKKSRAVSFIGSVLGRLLIHPRVEELFGCQEW